MLVRLHQVNLLLSEEVAGGVFYLCVTWHSWLLVDECKVLIRCCCYLRFPLADELAMQAYWYMGSTKPAFC